MKNITIFTGAGVSAESGVPTFRDSVDGLWYNYKVEEVATIDAWQKYPEKVLEFHNMLRTKLKDVEANDAHKALVKLEEKFNVITITQNVDDLHERAGSSNVLHLHGELFKSRSIKDSNTLYECLGDLNINDKAPDGSNLRPHTVLFGEYPYNVDESYKAIRNADIIIIIGTSLNISYTPQMLKSLKSGCKIYYVDPSPSNALKYSSASITYIRKNAVEGVTNLVNKLLEE